MLREIGTEIEVVYPPGNQNLPPMCGSTGKDGSHFTVWKYRISGHSETVNGPAETLEPLERRYVEPDCWLWLNGVEIAVPPDEIRPLLSKSYDCVRPPEGFVKKPNTVQVFW